MVLRVLERVAHRRVPGVSHRADHERGQGRCDDLDPRGGWLPGRCAQTLFARTQVILQEMDGATRVFARPSYADHLVDRLLAAS